MTTLEARIAEVLKAHVMQENDYCVCGWKLTYRPYEPYVYEDEAHRAHLTAMLAPVITSSNAKAWHEGFNDGKRQDAEGDDGPRFTNPYHADNLEAL